MTLYRWAAPAPSSRPAGEGRGVRGPAKGERGGPDPDSASCIHPCRQPFYVTFAEDWTIYIVVWNHAALYTFLHKTTAGADPDAAGEAVLGGAVGPGVGAGEGVAVDGPDAGAVVGQRQPVPQVHAPPREPLPAPPAPPAAASRIAPPRVRIACGLLGRAGVQRRSPLRGGGGGACGAAGTRAAGRRFGRRSCKRRWPPVPAREGRRRDGRHLCTARTPPRRAGWAGRMRRRRARRAGAVLIFFVTHFA